MTERWVARKELDYSFSDSSDASFEGLVLTTVQRLGSPGVDGQVWKVRYEEGDATSYAALKVFTNEILEGTKQYERFNFEATFPLQEEPQFVNVLTFGRLAGRRAILFELIDGLNLDSHLRDERDLDDDTRVMLARSVAESINAMHGHEMLHNDIKPQNIMVNSDGRSVRIIDLGFSCGIDEASEYFGGAESVGTTGFIAPEVFLAGARHASPASDAWSVAATCFYVLAGVDLFRTLALQSPSDVNERYQSMRNNQNEPLINVENLVAIGVQSEGIAHAMELMLTPLMAKRRRLVDPLGTLIEACTSYLEGDDGADGGDREDRIDDGSDEENGDDGGAGGDGDRALHALAEAIPELLSPAEDVGATPELLSPAEDVGTTLRVKLIPSAGSRQVILVQKGRDQYVRHQHLRDIRTHHRKIILLRWDGNSLSGMPRTGLPEATLNGSPWDSLREIENESVLEIDGLSVNIEYSEF